ncbi:MAG: hypothetical protein H7175_01460 [Burkholderiales bacterium]|nr:hypothetical protein [Anaerolineae bacterium]
MRKLSTLLLLILMAAFYQPTYAQKGESTATPTAGIQLLADIPTITLPGPSNVNYIAAWSPEGSLLATASEDTVHLWDATTGAQAAAIAIRGPVALAFNADSSLIAVAGAGGNILILKVDTLREIGEIGEDDIQTAMLENDVLRNAIFVGADSSRDAVRKMGFSGDSSVLLTNSGLPPRWRLWDISQPIDIQAAMTANQPPETPELTLDMGDNLPFSVTFISVPEGIRSLTTLDSGELSLQTIVPNLETGQAVFAPNPPSYTFAEAGIVSLSVDGSTLMGLGEDRMHVSIVEMETGAETTLTIAENSDQVRSADINADGSVMAVLRVNSQNGNVLEVWNVASAEVILRWGSPTPFFSSVQTLFSPDNTRLAVVQGTGIQILALPFERIAPTPAPSQVDVVTVADCDIDIQPAIALLINAQTAAAAGDSSAAAQFLADAQIEISAVQAQCGGASQTTASSSTDAGSGALTETFEYSGAAGRMSLSYPEGWIVREGLSGPDLLFIGSSAAALDKNFNQPVPPPFAPGQAVFLIIMGDPTTFLGPNPIVDLGDSPQANRLLGVLGQQITESAARFGNEDAEGLVIGVVTPITIGDHTAALMSFSTDGFDAAAILVDLETPGDGQPLYAVAIMFAAPGELDVALTRAVAESFELAG